MIKYVVNKEKRTVAAFFQDEEDKHIRGRVLLCRDLVMHLHSKFSKSFLADVVDEESVIPLIVDIVNNFIEEYVPSENCIRGIAKCNPTDKFSEEIGMRVAKEKLLNKERRIFEKFKTLFNRQLEKMFNELRYPIAPRVISF